MKTVTLQVLKTEIKLDIYIPKTFGDIFKKHNDLVLFDTLFKIIAAHDRETIYNGMEGNVVQYGLETLGVEYVFLDEEY